MGSNPSLMYYVYIVRCADDTLYTGLTTDLIRRLAEHNSSVRGAKYTRSRRPVTLVYSEEFSDRATASAAEFQIKKLPRTAKLRLFALKK